MRTSVVLVAFLAVMTRPANADSLELYVPEACDPYVSEELPQTPAAWDRWLSFAACTEVTSPVAAIVDENAIWPAVNRAALDSRPTLMMYLHAIDSGPPITQVRALHKVGMTLLTMVVRLRAAIPADRRTVHDQLELVITPALKAALTAFVLVGRHADGMCDLDAATASAIRESARYANLLAAFGIESSAAPLASFEAR